MSEILDSGTRRFTKHIDEWNDDPRLLAAAGNLLRAIQMTLKHPELVDVPWKESNDNGEN